MIARSQAYKYQNFTQPQEYEEPILKLKPTKQKKTPKRKKKLPLCKSFHFQLCLTTPIISTKHFFETSLLGEKKLSHNILGWNNIGAHGGIWGLQQIKTNYELQRAHGRRKVHFVILLHYFIIEVDQVLHKVSCFFRLPRKEKEKEKQQINYWTVRKKIIIIGQLMQWWRQILVRLSWSIRVQKIKLEVDKLLFFSTSDIRVKLWR